MTPSFDLLQLLIQKALDEGYPQSLSVNVSQNQKTLFKKSFGKKYKYYDIASLTKIMGTTPSLMVLFDKGAFKLNDPIETHLGFLKGQPVGRITISELLSHTSGLLAHENYYEEIRSLKSHERSEYLKRRFQNLSVKNQKKATYSDLDFILLGWIIEELTQLTLPEVFKNFIFEPLGLHDTFFNTDNKPDKDRKLFAPTEKCPWRKKILQGEVHDDNTWAMGGIAGHAGVFSTTEDVTRYGNELLKCLKTNIGFASKKTARKFLTRAISTEVGDWTLGFMLASPQGSSAGEKASPLAFGHTGYTGTSLWVDPKKNVVITILSNRVHPTRNDERFKTLRPKLHDAIWTQLT